LILKQYLVAANLVDSSVEREGGHNSLRNDKAVESVLHLAVQQAAFRREKGFFDDP
jgi:hypothetical protein